jgi:hypothetical protein
MPRFLPSIARARGLPASNWDRTSWCAHSSTHAKRKSGSIRTRPSLDVWPGSSGVPQRDSPSGDFERGCGTPEGGVKQGGKFTKGVWARRAKGDFHPLGPPYPQPPNAKPKSRAGASQWQGAAPVSANRSGCITFIRESVPEPSGCFVGHVWKSDRGRDCGSLG